MLVVLVAVVRCRCLFVAGCCLCVLLVGVVCCSVCMVVRFLLLSCVVPCCMLLFMFGVVGRRCMCLLAVC